MRKHAAWVVFQVVMEYYSKNNGMDPPVRIIDRRAQVCRHFKANPMIETGKRPSLKKQGLLPALRLWWHFIEVKSLLVCRQKLKKWLQSFFLSISIYIIIYGKWWWESEISFPTWCRKIRDIIFLSKEFLLKYYFNYNKCNFCTQSQMQYIFVYGGFSFL